MIIYLEFFLATAVILFSGYKLSVYGDVIAEKTGLSRLWLGVALMASVTSLPELATGLSAVLVARVPDIAAGGIFGSCAFNVFILGLLDILSRKMPLSARVHQRNILSAGFTLLLMGIAGLGVAMGNTLPGLSWIGIYTPILIFIYLASMRMIYLFEKRSGVPHASQPATDRDRKDKYAGLSLKRASALYAVNALIVIAAAIFLPGLAEKIALLTGLGNMFVGNIFVAVATSLPELAICIAAMKIGAVDMAVGNIFGSNLFNMMILALEDVFYFGGPLLAAAGKSQAVAIASAMAMTGLAISGLIYNSKKKKFITAWDSTGVIALYFANLILLYLMR